MGREEGRGRAKGPWTERAAKAASRRRETTRDSAGNQETRQPRCRDLAALRRSRISTGSKCFMTATDPDIHDWKEFWRVS